MLSNDTLNLALNIWSKLTSGDFANFRKIEIKSKNQYFDGDTSFCKALLVENDRGSLELQYLSHELHTDKQGFYAPCYVISNSGELYNLKQKAGYEPVISKVKDSLKVAFCEAANLDEKLAELLTNTKPIPKLEFVKVSEGYNLEGLPHSCQSGKGHRFEALDDMAKMVLLRIGSRIAARCIVWDSDVIFDVIEGKYLKERYADRLYYGDSSDRDEFIKALEAEGIELLWGYSNARLMPETGDYYIQIDNTSAIAWLDTFNLMKGDRLYSYDWVNGGYSDDTLNELVPKYGFTRAFLSVDEVGGTELEDYTNKVYSEWAGYYLDEDDAVYSEVLGDYLPSDDAVYSDFLNSYILADGAIYSSIEDDYIDENTLSHNTHIAEDIDRAEWVRVDNPDYVPYKGNEFKHIALDDSIYIEAEDWYARLDEALYIGEIDEYVPASWSAKDLKDRLADCMSSWTDEELNELVEKYGF
ncbi:hypothetical protein [Campylobacter concisus]